MFIDAFVYSLGMQKIPTSYFLKGTSISCVSNKASDIKWFYKYLLSTCHMPSPIQTGESEQHTVMASGSFVLVGETGK